MPNRTVWEQRLPAALFLLTCAGFGFGIWAHFPLLRAEFDRLPLWQLALLSVADVAGLVLFLRCVLRYATEGVAMPDSAQSRYLAIYSNRGSTVEGAATANAENRTYQKKVLRLYLLGFAILWPVELAASIALREVEWEDFRQAAVTVGKVWRVEKWEASKGMCRHRYLLHCSFRAAAGTRHETLQILCTDKYGTFPCGLAPAVQESLRRGRAPFAIRIAYRPGAPDQAWLADVGPGCGFDLHGFSLEVLFGQCFFMFVLVIGPLLTSAESGSVVEWRKAIASIPLSLTEAVPMMIEASWVAFLGYMEVTIFHRVV